MPRDADGFEGPGDEMAAPEPAEPCYECEIFLPDGAQVEFCEFDLEGTACGARRVEFDEFDLGDGRRAVRRIEGAFALGGAEEVLAVAAGVPAGDPWLAAVCRALRREREWAGEPGSRRPRLWVVPGEGELFHVTAVGNRESISRYGLDWHRMGAAPGIAGSGEPERAAVFVCDGREEAGFFTAMAGSPSDVWAVRAEGLWVENGPNGWQIITEPVGPERLRLADSDVPPRGWEHRPRRHGPSAAYQSTLTIRGADGTVISWAGGPPESWDAPAT
jgi:hypothetical protein